jgi:CRP/FNR family nitrogen fixation transcriptional regulator
MTAQNLHHVENHMLLLGRKTSHERVAAFLLEMNGRVSGPSFVALPMSRGDIADYLGLRLETVSRALSDFQRKGYLTFVGANQRKVVVLNAAGLTELDK